MATAFRAQYDESNAKIPRWRTYVQRLYGPLLSSLHISPDASKKVGDLIVERYIGASESKLLLAQINRQQGRVTTSGELRSVVDAINESINQDIRSILYNDSDYSQLRDALDSGIYFSQTRMQYAPEFSLGNHPLSIAQTSQLAKVLYSTFDSIQNPASGMSRDRNIDPNTGLTEVDMLAVERASVILDTYQLNILTKILAKETAAEAASNAANPPVKQ